MKITEAIKIGGIKYTVIETDRLYSGNNCTAEIDYRKSVIEISSNLSEQRKCRDFLHEIIHGIYDHLGYTEHDEKIIDELAGALYQIIIDNPEIFNSDTNNEKI